MNTLNDYKKLYIEVAERLLNQDGVYPPLGTFLEDDSIENLRWVKSSLKSQESNPLRIESSAAFLKDCVIASGILPESEVEEQLDWDNFQVEVRKSLKASHSKELIKERINYLQKFFRNAIKKKAPLPLPSDIKVILKRKVGDDLEQLIEDWERVSEALKEDDRLYMALEYIIDLERLKDLVKITRDLEEEGRV